MKSMFAWITALAWLGLVSACQSGDSSSASAASETDSLRSSVPNGPLAQLKALNQQIAQQPKDYGLYQSRSEVYYQLDSLSQSVVDIERALELYPEGPELHYWRGFLAYVADDTALARRQLRQAERLGSRNPEVPYQLGQLFFLRQQYARAQQAYQQAVRLDPKDPQYRFAQGLLAEAQGQPERAVQFYQQALALDSSYAKALTQLHTLYLEHYESEVEAMRYTRQLLRQQPSHPLGRFQEGNYHLKRALRYADGSQEARFRRHINEAVLAYTITVNKDPNFVEAWYNRGFCYFMGEGRINEAIRDFRKAAAVDSTHAPAHFMLGSIAEKNGDLRSALERYELALRYKPDSEDFRQAVQEVRQQLAR
jgi:tetratricopeptide (TPR) repeat protein